MINIHEILKYLPHRYPFILVDRVLSFETGKSLTALKNVTINEPFFAGHFPEYPVMPGVLILEALAQAACICAYKSMDTSPAASSDWLYFLAGIDNARFRKVVIPGDTLVLKVELLRAKQGIWKFNGMALVNDEEVCSAELISARKGIRS